MIVSPANTPHWTAEEKMYAHTYCTALMFDSDHSRLQQCVALNAVRWKALLGGNAPTRATEDNLSR